MKRGRISRCPYCGRIINYFFLYDCKRSDFGYCSHCGGIFLVKYSPLAYVLVVGAVGAVAGSFVFQYLANKSLPDSMYLLKCAAAALGVYFVLPFLIAPRKCFAHGRIGGFPPDLVPEYRPLLRRRRRKRAPDHAEVSTFCDTAELPHIGGAPTANPKNTERNPEEKIYEPENNNPEAAAAQPRP